MGALQSRTGLDTYHLQMAQCKMLRAAVLVAVAASLRAPASPRVQPTALRGVFDALVGGAPEDDIRFNEKVLPGRWRLNFALPAYDARRSIVAEFDDLVGYEPPQGPLYLVDADGGRSAAGNWQLSEDPDDRKDGLWVWGLFEEPLYPFLLLALDSERVGLPEGGTLAVRLNHKARPTDDGQILTSGTVAVRAKETVDADRMGLSKASLDVDTPIGTVTAQPMRIEEPS